jgi:uncharacterized membrane protein YjgN (DUF898 family)
MTEPSMSDAAAALPAFHPRLPDERPAQPAEHRLAVRFTGSGSEYFRIWIVNLLLTLVTLSLYYPWAKVRRLRYFHTNTLVGGQPLDFHGDPKKMLRGYLLVGLMVVLYSMAGRISPVAGLAAFLIVAAIWPALLKASMQFRLANTSWRGLRFRFKGSIAGAYHAMLPLFVPGLMFVAALLAVPDQEHPPRWYGGFAIGVMLLSLLVLPWLWWNLKKYQHDHYALGPLQTELKASRGSFYGVFLKTFGVSLAAMVAMVIVGGVIGVAGFAGLASHAGGDRGRIVAAVIGAMLAAIIGLLVVQLIPRPYFTSRMQNLLWSRTGNRAMRFRSELRFMPLLGLTLKNWLLMLLTLGLYWPFAAVATARMRFEAVSVRTAVDPDLLVDQVRGGDNDAAGDAAGDLFGLDIGL